MSSGQGRDVFGKIWKEEHFLKNALFFVLPKKYKFFFQSDYRKLERGSEA